MAAREDAAAPQLELRFESPELLEREFDANLSHGRAFVPGVRGIAEREVCNLVLIHPDGAALQLEAEAVWVVEEGEGAGVGLSLREIDAEVTARLAAFVEGDDPGHEGDAGAKPRSRGGAQVAKNVHQRVRAFTTAEQMRCAREGELSERIALERVYSKAVWEPLLQNPRVTPPEVTRIARKGNLPRPLLEQIVSNPAWLKSPELRRALLSNPKLGGAAIDKVLRCCSKIERTLVAGQSVYPVGVRNAAKKLQGR